MGYTEDIIRKKIAAITEKREKQAMKRKIKTASQIQNLKDQNQLSKICSVLDNDKLSAVKKIELILNQL